VNATLLNEFLKEHRKVEQEEAELTEQAFATLALPSFRRSTLSLHTWLLKQRRLPGAAVVGGATGYGVVAATGMTAAGMVGSGAGASVAAGPIGAALGAIAGLAAYGIYRIVSR